jgi:SAM-dependent methyltransferase
MEPLDGVPRELASHYDAAYFDWQKNIGEFGGWANAPRFAAIIKGDDTVLDFGCGGGYLLKNLPGKRKLGIEINPHARPVAAANGVEVFSDISEIPDNSVDTIVSNHCLEHVPHPMKALVELRSKLKVGGYAMFVVPCETIHDAYHPTNIDHHLYTWNPRTLGNLFHDAGYEVLSVKRDKFRWPPKIYQQIASVGGRFGFELAAKLWYYLDPRIGYPGQVRLLGRRTT